MPPLEALYHIADRLSGYAELAGKAHLRPACRRFRANFAHGRLGQLRTRVPLSARASLGASPRCVSVSAHHTLGVQPGPISVAPRKVLRVEPRVMRVAGRMSLPLLCPHVRRVVRWRADEDMIRPHARRGVAPVTRERVPRDGSAGHLVGDPMGPDVTPACFEVSVPLLGNGPLPHPARRLHVRLRRPAPVDLLPESIRNRARLRSGGHVVASFHATTSRSMTPDAPVGRSARASIHAHVSRDRVTRRAGRRRCASGMLGPDRDVLCLTMIQYRAVTTAVKGTPK